MIGAYFQCYKEPYATIEALKSFRCMYHDTTIVLLSDDGYDYSKVAETYTCIYIHDIHRDPTCETYLDRLRTYLPLIKEDYYMLLEDDVKVVKATNISNLKGVINGSCINPINISALTIYNPSIQTDHHYYSGHGGSIFNRVKILDILGNMDLIKRVMHDTNIHVDIFRTGDVLLSALCYINDEKIHINEGHCEMYTQSSKYGNVSNEVIHQYKKFYGRKLPDEYQYLIFDKCVT